MREISPLIPTPFDTHEFCLRLGRQRGRPIYLFPMDLAAVDAPCGMWVSTFSADIIAFADETSTLHRGHIILHEIAHMLCNHEGALGPGYINLVFPDIDPQVVRRMLGRAAYSSEEEREAETLASLLQERAGGWAPDSGWEVPAEAADVIRRLGRSLDHGP